MGLRLAGLAPAFLVTLCSCTTAGVWQTNLDRETISGVYFSEADKSMLVSGEEHAYLFRNLDDELWAALAVGHQVPLRLIPLTFTLQKDNSISGTILLSADKGLLSSDQEALLLASGFSEVSAVVLSMERELVGLRYAKSADSTYEQLEKPIGVTVIVPRSGTDNLKSVALTPVGLVIDTVVLPLFVIPSVVIGSVGTAL